MPDQDRKAIEKARHILEKNLVEPPSLGDLASQVGMSLSKFKQVFRQSYAIPPYAYLRKARMEKAMCMLQLDGARVTETALEVGYNSVSHFAKAFASYFGVSPSEARKRPLQNNGNAGV
jgi:AraC-like DNA-binding protein